MAQWRGVRDVAEDPCPRLTRGNLYRPPREPVLVEVPSFDFIMVDGTGDPSTSAAFEAAVGALYSFSYPVVIPMKRSGRADLKVAPLEGLWWADDLARVRSRPSGSSGVALDADDPPTRRYPGRQCWPMPSPRWRRRSAPSLAHVCASNGSTRAIVLNSCTTVPMPMRAPAWFGCTSSSPRRA